MKIAKAQSTGKLAKTDNQHSVKQTEKFNGKERNEKEAKRGAGGLSAINSVGAHSLDASRVIPSESQAMIGAISSRYGIPFDPSQLDLSAMNPGQIAQMQKAVELVVNNSRFLPIILENMRKLFRAEVKLAKFYKDLNKDACKAGYKIDKAMADAYLDLFNYKQKQSRLQKRVDSRTKAIEKRTQAYQNYYDSSVSAVQAQIIDAEFTVAAENKKALGASTVKRIEFKGQQRKDAEDYYQQAFGASSSDSSSDSSSEQNKSKKSK